MYSRTGTGAGRRCVEGVRQVCVRHVTLTCVVESSMVSVC